ncbi:MAG: nicotinamidase [Gammaproteobacteria bacterium]|nr:nicotinamidase [Gammaproteobacteria bacterium]NIR83732.1 nicotinamidase [Gammaproteobacteria bacterium]NIR91880.1 nicotinamidase [Gammaproteobacteria bacterium]NIU04898.1 nicotinamidase [Gammaproteobacteria bacterium]NIV51880.1 isochorismatase family protein [Gammaproteobacteria bacterium]
MATQTVTVDQERAVLLLVDIQPDFMPGGALPVEDGDAIVEPVARLMRSGVFHNFAATQDWHPRGHVSFASQHEGRQPFDVIQLYGHDQTLWPDHCIQGTAGAALAPDLPWERVSVIVRKGMDPASDSYSGFRNNWNPEGGRPSTGLAGYLRERGWTGVFVCGLARDVCVKWTAEDAAGAGFDTWVLWDLTRAVDPGSDDRVREDLKAAGARVITSDQLA